MVGLIIYFMCFRVRLVFIKGDNVFFEWGGLRIVNVYIEYGVGWWKYYVV